MRGGKVAKQNKKEQDILETAEKRLKLAVTADDHNRTAAIDDLKFANGDQWDPREKKRRGDKGRPALTLNFLPKFISQVTGDMLHNSPSIKIHPEDSKGDVAIAKIRQGIISSTEYQSNSKGVYGYAGTQQVTCGYGAWRVLTRYTDDNPFLQEMYLESVRNPFLMYLDPSSKDQNYADAKWGFLLEKMTREDFKEKYPKAQVPTDEMKSGKGLSDELWYDKDTVTVTEYFTSETETVTMLQLEDGRVVTEEEFGVLKKEWEEKQDKIIDKLSATPQMGQPPVAGTPPPTQNAPLPQMPGAVPSPSPSQGVPAPSPQAPPMPQAPPPQIQLAGQIEELGQEPKVAKRRDTDKIVIKHRIISCLEILDGGVEGKKFPGKYIPLVLVKGKELNIEGKNYVYSLIRHAKDPQKLINYWNSAAAETIALAPKAPWLATPKQIEGHEEAYATANVENYPVILYNVDPNAPGAPQRQQPGQPPVAMFEQIRRGEENLKSVIGMFNADVGAAGSEQTGAAITARQKPGDVATFEFMENLARAVMHTGRILNEMIPEIYDTERDVRVRHIDESESFVPVNTTVGNALKAVKGNPDRFRLMDEKKLHSIFAKDGKDAKYNDITVGKYGVVVTSGPSYATQRQEAAQHLLQLVQAMPQQMGLSADLLVQNLDFKDAEELAARLRKTLPPGMVAPRPGEPPKPPPPPPPQVLIQQAKLQMEQGKIELQKMKVEQEKVRLEHEKIKMQLEMMKLQAEKGGKAPEPDEKVSQAEVVRLQLERERLDLEKAKFMHQREHDGVKVKNESRKIEGELSAKMAELEAKARQEEKAKKDPLKLRKK